MIEMMSEPFFPGLLRMRR